MSSMNNKYDLVIRGLNDIKGDCTYASVFDLEYDEYKSIIDALEYDGLINRGEWCLSGGYHPIGLTFDGRNFIENNDSKKYHKIEKTEVHNSVNIENNHGIAVAGNNNTINNSEFTQKFIQLTNEIENSNIKHKDIIIQELNERKEDKVALQSYLGTLLTRTAEVTTIAPIVVELLGLVVG